MKSCVISTAFMQVILLGQDTQEPYGAGAGVSLGLHVWVSFDMFLLLVAWICKGIGCVLNVHWAKNVCSEAGLRLCRIQEQKLVSCGGRSLYSKYY